MLFTSAKVAQLAALPQGKAEAKARVKNMGDALLDEGFGNCTNHGACQEACHKGLSVANIARLNRALLVGTWKAAGD